MSKIVSAVVQQRKVKDKRYKERTVRRVRVQEKKNIAHQTERSAR